MKLSIALLALVFISTCSSQYVYDPIKLSDYSKYPLIPTLRRAGLNLVLDKALKNGHITSKQLILQTTNEVGYRKAEGNDNEFYKFNCSLSNGNNNSETVIASFVARYNTKTQEQAIPTWAYKSARWWWTNPTTSVVISEPEPEPEPAVPEPEPEVPKPEPTPEPEPEPVKQPTNDTVTDTIVYPWVLLPKAEYGSDFHVDNAKYGSNYFVTHEVAKGNITNGTYTVESVEEIYKQSLPNITNYRYHVQMDKAEDSFIYNVTFGLKFTVKTGYRTMGFYRFQTLDANGNSIGKGTLPDLAPLQNATQNVTTVIVDGKPVSSTNGTILPAK